MSVSQTHDSLCVCGVGADLKERAQMANTEAEHFVHGLRSLMNEIGKTLSGDCDDHEVNWIFVALYCSVLKISFFPFGTSSTLRLSQRRFVFFFLNSFRPSSEMSTTLLSPSTGWHFACPWHYEFLYFICDDCLKLPCSQSGRICKELFFHSDKKRLDASFTALFIPSVALTMCLPECAPPHL